MDLFSLIFLWKKYLYDIYCLILSLFFMWNNQLKENALHFFSKSYVFPHTQYLYMNNEIKQACLVIACHSSLIARYIFFILFYNFCVWSLFHNSGAPLMILFLNIIIAPWDFKPFFCQFSQIMPVYRKF